MNRRFEYKTVLEKGPQNGVYAEFPYDSSIEFGTRKSVPVKAWIDGIFTEMNLLPRGNGRHWLQINKELRVQTGKEEGDTIEIILEKNEAAQTLNLPDYLQWLLENDTDLMKYFQKLPVSAKKFWLGSIGETKNDEIKVERINRFFEFLRHNHSGKR